MAITVQDVAALRQRTGAPMMHCKQVLIESGGDFEKAVDLLRKKGQKIAADRAARSAAEGAVFAVVDPLHGEGFLLVLNCETDFVAKNSDFLNLGERILQSVVTHKPHAIAQLYALSLDRGSVETAIVDAIGTIGEKITIAACEALVGTRVVSYIHTGSKIGVLVALHGAADEVMQAVGKDMAMQIAAMNPLALSRDRVDPAAVERERAIIEEQLKAEGHSEDKVTKIIEGKLHKFFQENTLLEQPFVKNTKLTVMQYLHTISPALTITGFKRVGIGK